MAGMEVDDGPTKAGSKRNYFRTGLPNRSQQICKYWLEGRCAKGDACQWLHPDSPGTTGRPPVANSHDSNGLVNGNDLREVLTDGGSRRNATKWGGGRRGAANTKMNRAAGERLHKDKVCKYWLKGNCKYGDSCNFLHAHTASPEINLVKQLTGHDKAVRAIALPDGSSLLYSGGQDQTLRVWDCNTGECTSVVPMGGDIGALLSYGSEFLFIGLPNEVKIWDLKTITPHWMSNPRSMVLQIWDFQTTNLQGVALPRQGQVHALAIGAGMLFAGISDGSILAWKFDPSSNAFLPAASLVGHTDSVLTLVTRDNLLYSGSMDKSVKVWDLGTGQCLQTLEGHTSVVMQLLFWEVYILSCSLDGTVRVWNRNQDGSHESIFTFPDEIEKQKNTRNGALCMCGISDSTGKPVLVCSYNDDTVHLFDLPTFTERGVIETRDEVRTILFGPATSGLFFTGEGHGEIKVWRFATGANS